MQYGDHVVRSLGTLLWKRPPWCWLYPFKLRERDPLAVRKKKLATILPVEIHSHYPQPRPAWLWTARSRKDARGHRRADNLRRCVRTTSPLADAIDRLDASRGDADAASLAAQVAAVWSMVSDIDPELARRALGYARPPD